MEQPAAVHVFAEGTAPLLVMLQQHAALGCCLAQGCVSHAAQVSAGAAGTLLVSALSGQCGLQRAAYRPGERLSVSKAEVLA